MRILLIEDDDQLASLMGEVLTQNGYLVDRARDGRGGLELAEVIPYDLILLDVVLPGIDGISVCRSMRLRSNSTPILLMTAQDNRTNLSVGLDAGADDYLVKPIDMSELLAKTRALLRRGIPPQLPNLDWERLRLDPMRSEVTYLGKLLRLTVREYSILELFMRNPQRIFSQSALLDRLWSYQYPPTESTVRSHIKTMRQKLKKAGMRDPIETVYGLGYRLRAPANDNPEHELGGDLMLTPQIAEIWERSRPIYEKRRQVIARAVELLAEGQLDDELFQDAIRQAHTLAGSLGTFGLSAASELARELESSLRLPEKNFQTSLPRSLPDSLLLGRLQEILHVLERELTRPHQVQIQPLPVALPQPAASTYVSPQLLVVDDDTALTQALLAEAGLWGVATRTAATLEDARVAIATVVPDVVLLDLSFPEDAEGGFAILEELQQANPATIVVVFTASESFDVRVNVARRGARGFLQKPIAPRQVFEAIAGLLQQPALTDAHLMLVDDDPQMLDTLRELLSPWGFQLTLLDKPSQFWTVLERANPDLLVMNIEMPGVKGIDLCRVVRNEPQRNSLPIIMLSAHTDVTTIQQVYAAGADDYVRKPIVAAELVARILNRLERFYMASQVSEIDVATQLLNRRLAMQNLTLLLNIALRQQQTCWFALVKLDGCSQVSDRAGRMTLLKQFGRVLQETCSQCGVLARWSNDEFAVAAYGAGKQEGLTLLHTLQTVWQTTVAGEPESICRTFSAGIAEFPVDGSYFDVLYQSAAVALYRAQKSSTERIGLY